MLSSKRIHAIALSGALLVLGFAAAAPAQTETVVVAEFQEVPADAADLVPGTWYDWFTTASGDMAVVDLTGEGGNLELAQPFPTGAAFLTTEADNADRANAGVYDLLGSPGDVFPTLEIDYWFHKASSPIPTHNLNAAASLKMEIYNETCDETASGDCFGTLIFEPYVNGFGNHPPLDTWMPVYIDPNTGSGPTNSGGFWWSGGFDQPNSFAGPPYRSLNEWLALMSPDFQDATIVTLQIGVGSYNQGQRAYFDGVAVRHDHGDGLDVLFNFQAARNVEIDLRPGNDKNHINTNARQLVPLAILGSMDFDPTAEVDQSSVLVRGASPSGTKFDKGDVNGDGYDDLTLYFRARSFEEPSQQECEAPDATIELTGATFGDDAIAGSDHVEWLGPDCKF